MPYSGRTAPQFSPDDWPIAAEDDDGHAMVQWASHSPVMSLCSSSQSRQSIAELPCCKALVVTASKCALGPMLCIEPRSLEAKVAPGIWTASTANMINVAKNLCRLEWIFRWTHMKRYMVRYFKDVKG